MGIKARLRTIINRLNTAGRRFNRSDIGGDNGVTGFAPPVTQPTGGRPSLDFDLHEALRLRAQGWGNRRIARQMNNVSRETVRQRLREYDEVHKPVLEPKVMAPAYKPTKPAREPLKPLQSVIPSPVPVIPPAVPEPRPAIPEPRSNLSELQGYWKLKGVAAFEP